MSTNARSIAELCTSREVCNLLSWVLDGHEEMRPTWIRNSFGFPELALTLDTPGVTQLLEELASAGIFERVPFDRSLTCPICKSSRDLHGRFMCPSCSKYDLEKGSLVQHYACGYAGFADEFASGDDLICPKCRRELKLVGTDYRVVNNMFNCHSCGAKFSAPNITYHCYHCDENIRMEDLNLEPIWSYRFREEWRGEVTANCVIDIALADLYQKAGYRVERFKLLRGESGISHAFDIVATKDDENTVIIVAADLTGVNSQSVMSLFAKKAEVRPKHAILIAIPALKEEARRLAHAYRIETVEGKNSQEVIKLFQSRLWHKEDYSIPPVPSLSTSRLERKEIERSETGVSEGGG